MNEPRLDGPGFDAEPRSWRRDLVCLLVLVLLAVGLRAAVIVRTSVAARDSIGFIRYAWRLEHEPWGKVVKESLHPPLYPITILATAQPVRQVLHASSADCLAMQYSAQIATALAGVLLVIPMFYLGCDLFDRRVGFWSALLFQCMPVASRALSDGLTEGLFLLLTATFLLLAGRALRSRSVGLFILCGMLSGLAYLTRPEGAALALILGFVLLVIQLRPLLRWPWKRVLAAGVALPFAALIVAAPYVCTIKAFSNKISANWMLESQPDGKRRADNHLEPVGASNANLVLARMGPLVAEWDRGWKEGGRHSCSLTWAIGAFTKEVGKGFHYIVWVPAFLGLLWFGGRALRNPTAWISLALCLFYTLVLLRLAMVAGYISERHSLVFVLCGAPWAVAGMAALPARLAALAARLRLTPRLDAAGRYLPRLGMLGVAALCIYGVPNSLRALHPTRVGFREAGFWIATHADADDEVLDPFCWSRYYAGREFTDNPVHPHVRYIVLDNIYSYDHHSHLPFLEMAKTEARGHEPVYHWPTNVDTARALVFVYAVPWRPLTLNN